MQALKEFEENHGFLDQKVLMEPQWPDYNIIQNMLVRQNMQNEESMQILVLKLKSTLQCKVYVSTAKEIICRTTAANLQQMIEIGKTGHLAEFCDRIQQFTQKVPERITERRDYPFREQGSNSYQSRNQDTNAFYH